MLTAHHTVAFLVLGVTLLSAIWGGVAYFRRRNASPVLAHLLTLAQTVLVAQVGLGLLLLSDDQRAATSSTTRTGRSRCSRCSAPGSTRPRSRGAPRLVLRSDPHRGRARGARLHDRLSVLAHEPDAPRLPDHRGDRGRDHPAQPLRRARSLFLLAQIAFFIAIAFFIYLLWRERRSDIETWPPRAKFAFYGGALLIVAAIAYFIVDRPAGFMAIAFLFTLVLCGFAMWRTWRDQHTYS